MLSLSAPSDRAPHPDTAVQPRIDPAAENDDPSKAPGDPSQLTPDDATLDNEKPFEDAIEKTFPPGRSR